MHHVLLIFHNKKTAKHLFGKDLQLEHIYTLHCIIILIAGQNGYYKILANQEIFLNWRLHTTCA